jgi:ferredoxin
MAELFFESTGEEVELKDDSPVAEECEKQGIPFACTEGICGTCIVRILKGMENLSLPTQQEIDFLGEEGTKHERMMCQCRIKQGSVQISH